MKEISHSFLVNDVQKYGSIEKALIMKEIKQMSAYKARNKKDGWVYYSRSALAEKFPYMKANSIKRWMLELEKDNWLKVRVKNEFKYDKTKSYFPVELDNSVQNTPIVGQNDQPIGQNDQPIGQNDQTIPPLSTPQSSSQSKDSLSDLEGSDNENSLFVSLAKKLGEIVKTKHKVKITSPKLKSWASEIRKLNKTDGISLDRISKALSWYADNIGGEFIPVIESGRSLRSKFLKLESAIERDSAEVSQPSFKQRSEVSTQKPISQPTASYPRDPYSDNKEVPTPEEIARRREIGLKFIKQWKQRFDMPEVDTEENLSEDVIQQRLIAKEKALEALNAEIGGKHARR